MRYLIVALLVGTVTSVSGAQNEAILAETERYLACLDRVETEPEEAFEDALTWRMHGGGWPARHCEARALIASGDVSGGAAMLEALASETRPGSDEQMRVSQLFEAGNAWLDYGQPADARRAYDAGLALFPDDRGLLAGRARASADLEDWDALAADGDQLIALSPASADGWHFRAQARLEQGDLDGSEADMNEARQRAPEQIEILVLRGRIIEARRLAAAED
jgi:tetratricopeptide (TPR) repeat protein